MSPGLARKIALIVFVAGLLMIFAFFKFTPEAKKMSAVSPVTSFVSYSLPIIFVLYMFGCAIKILKGGSPFGYILFLKKDVFCVSLLLLSLISLVVVNLLYFLYYPPFQNKVDFSFYRISTPFLTFVLVISLYFKAIASTIYFHHRENAAGIAARLVIEYMLAFLILEQIVNIIIAYVLWK